MPKDEQTYVNQEIEKQKQRGEDFKTTIYRDVTSALMAFASVIPSDKFDPLMNSRLYEEVNGQETYEDEDMKPLAERALDAYGKQSRKGFNVMGGEINVTKVLDSESFSQYKGKISQMADKIDELIDQNITNDEYGRKSKDFVRSMTSGYMRRIVNGYSNTYLSSKNILGGSLDAMYAVLNASTVDNKLQNNIEKWQHTFPIHQLVIDGEKQMCTMSDYWKEKERGSLSPEREKEYRQKLYDQTQGLTKLFDKVIEAAGDRKINEELQADSVLGNEAFHLDPRTNRGMSPLLSGLKAMTVGLENGWEIDDIGRLASYYQLMYRTKTSVTCNGGLTLDTFTEYDPPKYASKEQEEYVKQLEDAWKNVEKVKLENVEQRNHILSGLDDLVKDGLKKGYLKETSPGVPFCTQTMEQAVVRDQLVASGQAAGFCAPENDIVKGQQRGMTSILGEVNAARTDAGLKSESLEHKNMRTSIEKLSEFIMRDQEFMQQYRKGEKGKEDLEARSYQYIEKLNAVQRDADLYKDARVGASTQGGKNRLRGADAASAYAGMEMDTVMRDLKKAGICAENETPESFQISQSLKRKGFEETIRDQDRKLGDLMNELKKVDKWTSSPNFKNMKNAMQELKSFSSELAKGGKGFTEDDLEQYEKLVNNVNELASTYLENKKDISSDYAKSRVKAVRKLQDHMKSMSSAMEDLPDQHRKLKEQELFGDKYKLFGQFDHTKTWNASAFWGEKYKNKESRQSGPYSTGRNAAISVSIFALANTGKYSMEDIMDPSKLRAEKQEMFDKTMTAMKNHTPEDQKWIAETIYEGQKNTERMADECASKIDFSKVDVATDKNFCQLLHLSYHQFDAWQEMAHCKDEIMELAKKDHPEMKQYEDYKVWWTNRQGMMCGVYTNISRIKNIAYECSMKPEIACNEASRIVQETVGERLVMNEFCRLQEEKKDIPFHEWVTEQLNQEMFLATNMCSDVLKDSFHCMMNSSEITQTLLPKFWDGTITKNVSAKVDLNEGELKIDGFPSGAELTEMAETLQTQKFLEKTDAALGRLENGKYTSKKSFIEDCAYAMIGQMYRTGGQCPPEDPTTGKTIGLEEYKNRQMNSKEFLNSLKSPENPKAFISPKKVAEMAKNMKPLEGADLSRGAQRDGIEHKRTKAKEKGTAQMGMQ